jgi:hypothetical protein
MPVKLNDKNIEASNIDLEPRRVVIFVNIYHPWKFVRVIDCQTCTEIKLTSEI